MTLIFHVSAVKNLLAHGSPSDDFSYSSRLIAHFLQVARARLIEQKADKYHFISDQSYQSLCVDLELSNFHNCCNDVDLDCKIMKSLIEIPKFLNSRWGNFLKVMDLSGRVIPEFNLTQSRFSEFALAPVKVGWFIHDNHVYLVENKHLSKILLNGLFDDPSAIHELNCPSVEGECLDFMDTEFPIDSDLIDPMYRLALEFLLQSMRLPKDNENNSKDAENQTIQ